MLTNEFILVFLLVLVRMMSYVFVMPVISMRQIPMTVKLGLVVTMTFLTTLTLPPSELQVSSLASLGLLIVQESCLGIALAYTSMIIFLGIQSAGDLIDFTAGLKMASSYDPITGSSGSLYSSLYNWFAVILFFNMDGHHYLFKGITNSFYLFELGQEYILSFQLDSLVYLISKCFLIAIQLALPVGIVLFLIDIVLGMISKVIPQMNVFLLGMSLKIGVSFGIHILILAGILQSISWALDSVVTVLDYFIKTLM